MTDTRLAARSGPRRYANAGAHVSALAVAASGAAMLLAGLVEAVDGGPHVAGLLASGIAVLAAGAGARRVTRLPDDLPIRAVFAAVGVAWLAVAATGAVPYLATGVLERPDDALFEAVSGFTTTGATVLPSLGTQSTGILLWRSLTQWMGGLGVVVLVVAVLPYLGAGGMSLLRSEVPGPASERLAPRVRDTARKLWAVYVGFTVVTALAYLLAGMPGFDAVAHALTTVSTGGFSTREANFGAFDSSALEWVAVGAMFLAGTSFVLLYRAVRGQVGPLLTSVEARAYLLITAGAAVAVTLWNGSGGTWNHHTVRESVFSVVSVASTTGFTTADFGTWITPAQAVLLFLMLIGAMTGSTAGGSKIFRLLTAVSYARRELLQHVHPRMVGAVRLGRDIVPEEVAARVLGYHALFFGIAAGGVVAVASFDVDIVTSVSGVVASISNVGPALGEVSPSGTFAEIPAGARAVSMLLMLLGRLEVYPLLLGVTATLERIPDLLPSRLGRAVVRRAP